MANFVSYATLFGVFFLVPFALVRIYQDTALAAGLRLSILPVMLGLLAPVGGMLYDRLGARLPTCFGMLICIAGLAILYLFLDGNPANLWLVTLSLAVIGVGQGLFISPNSSAIMSDRAGRRDRPGGKRPERHAHARHEHRHRRRLDPASRCPWRQQRQHARAFRRRRSSPPAATSSFCWCAWRPWPA